MKELVSCEADVSGSMLGLSPPRARDVDFSLPIMKLELTLNIVLEQSLQAIMNMWAYLGDAFAPLSWITVALACLLLFLGFLGHFRRCDDAVTVVFKTLLLRDFGGMHNSLSYLVLYMTTSLLALYLFACYSAMITSTMTLGKNGLQLVGMGSVNEAT